MWRKSEQKKPDYDLLAKRLDLLEGKIKDLQKQQLALIKIIQLSHLQSKANHNIIKLHNN